MRTFSPFSPVVLLAVALLPSLRGSWQAAPAPQDDVLTRPARIADEPLPAFSVFQGALLVSGVPGGAAFVQGCSDQPLPMVHPHGTTLREVLDSITGRDSGYVWVPGVVNTGSFARCSGLQVRLKTLTRDLDAGSAETFLSSSPRYTCRGEIGLVHNVSGSALSGIARTTSHQSATRYSTATCVARSLNAIARASKHGVWIYSETLRGVTSFNVSFAQ
jgi:hypothetical protein